VLIACLALAVVTFLSREAAALVEKEIVPLLNQSRRRRKWLIGMVSGVLGYVVAMYSK
jgi:hypothetical protein